MSDSTNQVKTIEYNGSEIAIIGMACRFPGARNPEKFWNNLCSGVESISFLTDEELLSQGVSPELIKNPNYIKAASVLEDFDKFDAPFFGYTPKEAELMDPQHRLFLECAWEALEDAGYNPENYGGSIGVYGGAKTDTYLFNISSNRELLKSLDAFQIALGNDLGCLSTRVSYKLDLKGPSYAVHTACSTSLVAVHLACQSLLIDECQMAIAGGVTVNVPHRVGYLYQPGGIMSPDGHCHAFDAKASGTVFGSGAGIVILKRLEDAIRDRDHIYAVIKGSAVNNDGSQKASYTAPGVDGQTRVIMEALANAGLDADAISYVETHGTGTNLGDPIEIRALTDAFRASTSRNGYCAIGSVKSNVGHLDAAAGICSLIKTVLALRYGMIPPSLHYEKPNPKIDFDNSPFYVNTKLTEWKRKNAPNRAGVSSFGFGSTNAHIVLEEAPRIDKCGNSRPYQLLAFSARSEKALDIMGENLIKRLNVNNTSLADMAYTLKVGRKTFNYRRVVVCSSIQEASYVLENLVPEKVFTAREEHTDYRTAFIFTEQDDLYINTAKDIYLTEEIFKKEIDTCCKIFRNYLGFNPCEILYPLHENESEVTGRIEQQLVVKSLSFILGYAMAKLMISLGIKPNVMTGYGIGEYTAACISGEISLEDAIRLSVERISPVHELRNKKTTGISSCIDELLIQPDYILIEMGGGQFNSELIKQNKDSIGNVHMISMFHGHDDKLSDNARLMADIGKLWLCGARIDWEKFYENQVRYRIPLPAYPFERQYYWINSVEHSDASGIDIKQHARIKNPIDEWLYSPEWIQAPICPSSSMDSGDKNIDWLIFEDDVGLGKMLLQKLHDKKYNAVSVKMGDGYVCNSDLTYIINPENRDDYVRLLDDLQFKGLIPRNIVHLWSVEIGNEKNQVSHSFEKSQINGYYSLLNFVQAYFNKNTSVSIWVIANNTQKVQENDLLYPEKATILGPCKVIPQEYPDSECKYIDIDDSALKNAKSLTDLAAILLNEFLTNDNNKVIAYRNNQRWVQVFNRIKPAYNIRNTGLVRDKGVYVITGGLGIIGFSFAEFLAQYINVRLAFICRSNMPPRDEWDNWLESHSNDDSTSIKISKLKNFEKTGTGILILNADVSDINQMQNALQAVQNEFGEINGIIHAAGVTGENIYFPVKNTGKSESDVHFHAKVHGLVVLDRLTEGKNIDFCILVSSISSILGGLWNTAYSASNIFMDAFAQSKNSVGNMYWMSINWDSWHYRKDTIQNRRLGETLYEYAITPDEGKKVLGHILSCEKLPQMIISTGDIEKRLNKWVAIEKPDKAGSIEETTPGRIAKTKNMDIGLLESEMTILWQKILGIKKVKLTDNFFDIGGNSLTGLQLINEIKNQFDVQITPVALYEAPTIINLVKYISSICSMQNNNIAFDKTASDNNSGNRKNTRQDIAIIGAGIRFPGAGNVDEYWQNIVSGVESIHYFSDEELEQSGVDIDLINNPDYVKARPILGNIDEFDADFFEFTPREVEIMDPQHRLFLECAWEALENSGYDPEKFGQPIGIFAGASISTYLMGLYDTSGFESPADSLQAIIGNDKDSLTTMVSYKLNLKGPSMAVQAFCSTSLVAVHMACRSILDGECEIALAGGSSININEKSGYLYQEGGIFSPDGHCRAFDENANGTLFGNGVGVVVLKRLDEAVAHRDNIYAVIKGSAINNDGNLKTGYTAPGVEGQSEVIAKALDNAGIKAETITYIESHGTGTQMGDPIEVTALTKAFRKSTKKNCFCALGSVKTNVGHLDRCAGIAGLIKAMLCLKRKMIPPILHFNKPNHKIDLENSPFYICKDLMKWETEGIPRRAGVSSLGFGGTNVHIVLEEAPETELLQKTETHQLLVLSAKTHKAMEMLSADIIKYMERVKNDKTANISDMAFTLQVGRKDFNIRKAVVCKDFTDAIVAMSTHNDKNCFNGEYQNNIRQTVFIFPEQGFQYAGMGWDLYKNEPLFRSNVDNCIEMVKFYTEVDLKKLFFSDDNNINGIDELLKEPGFAFLVNFIIQYATARLLTDWGLRPKAMIGSGIGEFTAACLAGVFELKDAFNLICTYLNATQNTNSTTDRSEIKDFSRILSGINPGIPSIPYISCTSGDWVEAKEIVNGAHWIKCLSGYYKYPGAITEIMNDTSVIAIVFGNDTKLDLIKVVESGKNNKTEILTAIRFSNDSRTDTEYLMSLVGKLYIAGIGINWNEMHRYEERRRIVLPAYPFERRRYWMDGSDRRPGHDRKSRKPDVEDWFGSLSWKRSYACGQPDKSAFRNTTANWLIFEDEFGLGDGIFHILDNEKQNVVRVRTGKSFGRKGKGTYSIDPLKKRDYFLLLDDLIECESIPDTIIHLWNTDREDKINPYAGFESIAYLSKAIGQYIDQKIVNLWVVSSNLYDINGNERLYPQKAGIISICKGITSSNTHIVCRGVDVELTSDSKEQLPGQILAGIMQNSREVLGAFRGRYKWIPFVRKIKINNDLIKDDIVKENGVYLLFRGLDDLGYHICEYLAKNKKARLVIADTLSDFTGDLKFDIENEHGAICKMENMFSSRLYLQKPPEGFEKALDELCTGYLYYYLYDSIECRRGYKINKDKLKEIMGVTPKFHKFFNYIISILEKESVLKIENNFIEFLKDHNDVENPKILKDKILDKYPDFKDGIIALDHCAKHYKQALSEQIEAVGVLYPDGKSDMLMAVTQNQDKYSNIRMYKKIITELFNKIGQTNKRIKILEIGAGDGKLTWNIVESLNENDLNLEYHFTDIGKAFIVNGEKKALHMGLDFMKFGILDISRSPAEQGYDNYYFDIILALDVVHATPCIVETIDNLKRLLAPNGIMLLLEATKPQRWVNMIWGLAEGWWYFSDTEIREDSPLMRPDKWEAVLGKLEFKNTRIYPAVENERLNADHSLIVIQQHEKIDTADYKKWLLEKNMNRNIEIQQKNKKIKALKELGAEITICDSEDNGGFIKDTVRVAFDKYGRIDGMVYLLDENIQSRLSAEPDVTSRENMTWLRNRIDEFTLFDGIAKTMVLDFVYVISANTIYSNAKNKTIQHVASMFVNSYMSSGIASLKTKFICTGWNYYKDNQRADCSSAGCKPANSKNMSSAQIGKAFALSLITGNNLQVLISPYHSDNPEEDGWNTHEESMDSSFGVKDTAFHARPDLKTEYVPSQNDIQTMLTGIWQEVLGIGRIGINDDFFELGGDSLMATQLNSRMRNVFNAELSLLNFFKSPTIKETAAVIENINIQQEKTIEEEILKKLEMLNEDEVEEEIRKLSGS